MNTPDYRTQVDHLLAALRTVRHLMPRAVDAPNLATRYALETIDAKLGIPAPESAPTFALWDVVANKFGPASDDGFPLRLGSGKYADAIVACVSPLVLISREGATKWENITPEQARHLVVTGKASDLEAGPAFTRMRRELLEAMA